MSAPRMTKWIPTSDPLHLRRLGKLSEELSEGGKAAARAIIQGIDGIDPASGVDNRTQLWKELADIEAQIECCKATFDLPRDRMAERREVKLASMAEWEAMFAPDEGREGAGS